MRPRVLLTAAVVLVLVVVACWIGWEGESRSGVTQGPCIKRGTQGGAIDAEPVVAALEQLRGPHYQFQEWTHRADPITDAQDALRRVLLLPQRELEIRTQSALSQLADAQVILVADHHDLPPLRLALARELGAWSETRTTAEPVGATVGLEVLRRSDAPWLKPSSIVVDELMSAVRRGTLFETSSYRRLLRKVVDRKATLVGIGGRDVHGAQVRNVPWGTGTEVTLPAGEHRQHLAEMQAHLLQLVRAWQGRVPAAAESQLVLLIGADHVIGEFGCMDEIRRLGLNVVAVLPLQIEWELALFRRFGGGAAKSWFQPRAGLLRPPWVTPGEIAALPAAKPANASHPSELDSLREAVRTRDTDHFYRTLGQIADAKGGGEVVRALAAELHQWFGSSQSSTARLHYVRCALGCYEFAPHEVRQIVSEALRDSALAVRHLAALEAVLVDPSCDPVRSALLTLLREPPPDEHPSVIEAAALSAGAHLLDPRLVVPPLVRALDSHLLYFQRVKVLSNLGHYGPHAAEGIPAVRRDLASADRRVSSAAAAALERILDAGD